MPFDAALSQLKKLDPKEAQALLSLLEEKTRREQYIKVFQPYDGQLKVFEAFTPEIKELYVLGGNRAGKTIIGAAICIAFLLGKEFFKD